MTANKVGPTDMAMKRPTSIPFTTASNICNSIVEVCDQAVVPACKSNKAMPVYGSDIDGKYWSYAERGSCGG